MASAEEERSERPGPEQPGDGAEYSLELQRAEERLRRLLGASEPALMYLQRLLVWERPAHSGLMLASLSGLFWLFSSTSLRPIFLISSSLLGILLLERWKNQLLPEVTVQHSEDPESDSDGSSVHPRLLRLPELCHCLAESWVAFKLYLQEVAEYKRQNPGQFCLKMCVGSAAMAGIGHYIPGIMISYIFILSVLLWPLVVYHELIQKMYTGIEPVLMKLDYSMKGGTQHPQRERKKKRDRKSESSDEPTAETESESEAELSCFNSKADPKTTALALAITDSELSDEEASILESGGFTVSRGTTPQLTDVSEDLDQQSVHSEPEEAFAKDLPEFPSVEDFAVKESEVAGEEETPDRSAATAAREPLSFIQTLTSPLHFVNTHFNGSVEAASGAPKSPGQAGMTLEAFSEEIVSSAISSVVQNALSALLSTPGDGEGGVEESEFLPTEQSPLLETELRETEEEVDDFELLDQGELDQMDTELGLTEQQERQVGDGLESPQVPATPPRESQC
ncbi:reticulophagy regulator 2 [Callorhinchus milii]|uniref:reticulophagy regulator 2 n=1 Tax=Callorhinchus milii TaxID=7868 RepID=UPI0004572F58|nr:reticulophagy regulator 2 [Callorhinchus milii]|eukprot:gi/632982740/ref/XP_007908303.1/ PREDICTED: protein FAM134A [Callorhinchus milii]